MSHELGSQNPDIQSITPWKRKLGLGALLPQTTARNHSVALPHNQSSALNHWTKELIPLAPLNQTLLCTPSVALITSHLPHDHF